MDLMGVTPNVYLRGFMQFEDDYLASGFRYGKRSSVFSKGHLILLNNDNRGFSEQDQEDQRVK